MRPFSLARPAALAALSVLLCQPQMFAQGNDLYRAPSSFAGKSVVLPIGTTFEGRIQSTIGSRQSHNGESFSVEVSAPVMANGSEVIIPAGSEITGEVAEAIPSSSQPHDKGKLSPLGILRVQLTGLRMPDGQSYPLVASFAPDGSRNRAQVGLNARKSTVAYVGSQAGFDAVNPANRPRKLNQGQMQVMKKSELLGDAIYGDQNNTTTASGSQIRALVRKGRELIILRGSSMTIRLDSPLKLAMGGSAAQSSIESAAPDQGTVPGGKHFAKTRQAAPQQGGEQEGGMAQGQQQAGGYPPPGGQPQQGGYPQQGGQQAPVEQPGSSF